MIEVPKEIHDKIVLGCSSLRQGKCDIQEALEAAAQWVASAPDSEKFHRKMAFNDLKVETLWKDRFIFFHNNLGE